MPVLEIRNLSKSYGKNQALSGIDIKIMSGDSVVVTGPSGCGKSTLLRCIVRLINPDSGRIIVEGKDITDLSYLNLLDIRRRIGFVFQRSNLIQRLSAMENVILPLLAAGVCRDEADERGIRALGRVGLAGNIIYRKPPQLSGGECQRVAIARALAPEPVLMLWDEPTASLDPILVMEVLEVMESLIRHSETAMVIVTHEMRFALRAANRLILLNEGRIVEQGTPVQIFSNPKSELGMGYSRLVNL
ncbi:MAG: amino acid ABC transporter ATP-binding protein [Firmicutes bacterium]|nr:amino acid ABC transporter ATP-binding protein [Bacillota bacterium]